MRIGVVLDKDVGTAVTFEQLERACAAVQNQLREVCQAWHLDSVTVEPCPDRTDFEHISYVTVSKDPTLLSAFRAPAAAGESRQIDTTTSGEHGPGYVSRGADGRVRVAQPYAKARFTPDRPDDHRWWTVTLSHECIEMAVNPNMDQTIKAPALAAFAASGHAGCDEAVEYLKEICDPCQSGWHAYPYEVPGSDQPIWLSDFLLPEYFNRKPQGARFSFTGSVTKPLEILTHGCLSWGVPRTKKLWQQWRFDNGKLSDFILVRGNWEPAPAEAGRVAPLTAQSGRARESLYAAQPDYQVRRIPTQERVADAVRDRKRS